MIFLGGTCNNSTWRDELIPLLDLNGIVYFNPVVPDWTPECVIKENEIKSDPNCIELYIITSHMVGVYSIAEAVDASNKKPSKVIFGFLKDGFDKSQIKSLEATANLIKSNGSSIVTSLAEIPEVIKKVQKWERLY